jgi:sulfite dehydrogenase (quinone) subunit SoeC
MSYDINAMKFNWMVTYTPHESWISGKGVYLWLAFFFTEIFAGTYLVSLFLNLERGLLVGWVGALTLGGFFHVLYLGKATRGWRIMFQVSSSELSRGLWITVLFGAVGLIQLLPLMSPDFTWAWDATIFKVIMGILSVLVIIHGFTTMSVVRALPTWNSPIMIPLGLASGVWIGSQLAAVTAAHMGVDMVLCEQWSRWSLFFYMGCLLIYLWGNWHASETAKVSTQRILAGDLSKQFYIGTVLVGILIPLAITLSYWGSDAGRVSESFVVFRLLCAFAGDGIMRHVLMKSPVYAPLI